MEIENWLKVFYEEAWANSLIPFANNATFTAMQVFGGHNMPMAVICATAGATAGLLFNWAVGQLLLKLHGKSALHINEKQYAQASNMFNKYGIFLLLFSWVPLLKILMVFAGFLGTPLRIALPLVAFGQLFYFLSLIS